MGSSEGAATAVTLSLVDPAKGHLLQSWDFEGQPLIRIGRAQDNDVVTLDHSVSRYHVELAFADGHWTLFSLGRNGVYVDDVRLSEARLNDGDVFQLASDGPKFQFANEAGAKPGSGTETLADATGLSFLSLDERKREEEVRQVTDGEFFKEIESRLAALKRRDEDAKSSE